MKADLTVVIPVYNEADNLDELTAEADGATAPCVAAGDAGRAIEYPPGRLRPSRGGSEHWGD